MAQQIKLAGILRHVDQRELEALMNRVQANLNDFAERAFGGPQGLVDFIGRLHASLTTLTARLPEIEAAADQAQTSVFETIPEKHGWFFDSDMTAVDVFQAERLHREGPAAGLDDWFVGHYRERLDAIERVLVSRYPARAEVLTAAWTAHRSGQFALSIPVLLAQADGLSRDLIGAEYFAFRKTEPLLPGLWEAVKDDWFLLAVLRGLSRPGRLRASSDGMQPGELNRHAIMHGLDSSYGTERNSLKAVSLVNFMSQALELKRTLVTPPQDRTGPALGRTA